MTNSISTDDSNPKFAYSIVRDPPNPWWS